MSDFSRVKLGKGPVRVSPKTLKMARYFMPSLPPPPASVDWTKGRQNWGMMENDVLGDCVFAGGGHAIQVWTALAGGPPPYHRTSNLADATILSYYENWAGYNPADPSTDQGYVELDYLTKWRKYGLAGHRLYGFASVDVGNLVRIKQTIWLFGGAYIGVALPNTAQNQNVWDVVPGAGPDAEPGSWGGHAVFVPMYNSDTKTLQCITWGQNLRMTEAFWNKYVEEAYGLLSCDWVAPEKGLINPVVNPLGFDLPAFSADLQEITA